MMYPAIITHNPAIPIHMITCSTYYLHNIMYFRDELIPKTEKNTVTGIVILFIISYEHVNWIIS